VTTRLRRRATMSRRAAALTVTALAAALSATVACGENAATPTSESPPPYPVPTLVGLTGRWLDTTVDGPALVVNGEAWSGTTAPADLEPIITPLFGVADSTLLRTWTTENAFPVAVAPAVDTFSSGTIRTEFKLLGGASDQNAGIIFGMQPNGEYHYLRYNTKDGNVALWKFVNGAREVIKHGDVHKQLDRTAWHELVVTINGREVSGHIAGDTTIAVRHTLDTALTGRVGIWVKRDAITAIRGFVATRAP